MQLHEELQRRRGAPVPFAAGEYETIVAEVRPAREPTYEMGIGQARDECLPGSGSFRDPRCYKYDTPICGMARCPATALAQAGQAVALVQVEPLRATYLEALACRMSPRDAANEDLVRSVRLTGVHCNGEVRDVFDDAAPTAATTQYVLSDQFELPDPYAVPVPWGVFGKINDSQELRLTFWVEYNANVAVDINVVILGVALPANHPRVLKMISGNASAAM